MVQRILRDVDGVKLAPYKIRNIMNKLMGMRYKKIVKGSLKMSSLNNLVLRQQWAVRYLELWDMGRTFINVDETWLGMSDFR